MARSRRQRGRGFLNRVKSAAAATPLGQAATQAARDYRSLVNSPAASMLRQAYGVPPPKTGYANPYGRSAGPVAQPVAVPMARPVPVAQPVAAPMTKPVASSSDPRVDALVSALIWNETDTNYRTKLAKEAARLAKDVKKSSAWNQSLQDALSALAKEVTTLVKDQGVQPGPTHFRTLTEPAPTGVIESLSGLMDPAFRATVAQRLATHKRVPEDQRFLPGTVNQLAAAIRTEVQRVAFGGRKTRRGRKARRMTRRSP